VKTAAYRLQTLFDNRLHLSLNDLKDAFSVEKLNKDFYQELSHWYFWAISQAHFPFLHIKTNETDAIKKEKNNAQQLIRLITRVIFIWFMKQKKLLPQALFDADELAKIVKDFNAPNASGYYNAILQNLFFGTLNQPVTERKFAKDGDFPANKSEYGVKSLYRYANKLTITEEQACQLFRTIPFLNGGLFDCLDDNFDASTPGEGCIDGFSRNPKHTAVLPDDLFFGQEKEVDLNTAFNTKKKVYKVKGLFHLLNAYQFTTNENTTLDIEVALDPELLGKVFENLLACYNPETQNTARNDTGSFYTPREIVSYMVDESLLTILTQQIGSQYSDKIKTLLTTENFENNTIELTTQERNQLIEAIDKLRILDPACGSGAYPMGILHAMVQLLQRIDPDNKLWREYQREKMIGNKIKELENDRTIVEKLSDDLLRQRATAAIEDRLNELETLFNNENHESDYTRKLYLIENCIYGIDLQPIAVQISKLRFFISLVIDQNTTDTGTPEDNYGIRSLPNLETKFVAADALIKLHSSATQELAIVGMDDKEQKLRNNRHEYFLATTRKRKIELQKEAQKIRGEIAALLTGSGWNMQNAQKIADFDPYNQNKQANWFDPKYMFGINSGFDIVIGNPPYIQLQNNSGKLAELYANQQYATYARTGDIYMLFYERGHQLLKNNGILCYITSNKWMRTAYGEKLRIFFSTVTQPTLLFDFSGHKIFESATVDVNILQFTKAKYEKDTLACTAGKDYSIDKTSLYFSRYALPTRFTEGSWVLLPPIAQDIKQKVEKIGIPLKDWDINIYRGVITGLNEAFIIDQAKRDELVAEDPKSADIIRPILRGRDIQKYKANWANYWVITVIFGAHKTLEKEYPAVYKHLLTYEVELKKRGQCRYTSGGKVNTTRDY
ncbi:MAG: class I SAM-dependent DNA methyltransferase, partial [Chitinophagia bacterium]|nr:class I SAM-dependent DNA methyltransferase [Chitinophagia bacterium]